MTSKIILGAAVAGLAIMAPAQAQRGDRAEREQKRAEKAEQPEQQARAERPERQERARVERPKREERARVERPQRQERQVRIERQERPQREERARVERPQRQERQVRIERQERVHAERPQRQIEARAERPRREERSVQRQERVRVERPRREQRAERVRPEREQRVQARKIERERLDRRERRAERVRPEREQRVEVRKVERERLDKRELRGAERLARRNLEAQRFERVEDRPQANFDRKALRQEQKFALKQQRLEARLDRQEARAQQRSAVRAIQPLSVGTRYVAPQSIDRDWYDDLAAQRYRTSAGYTPDYFYDYDYDDGYLYQVSRDSNLVAAAFPLLGGAFGVGQLLPSGYDSYNVPYGYRSLYYDTPDYSYRYGDGAIYRVDPGTQLVSAIVALLSGQRFGIGQQLPQGFDVYNVPQAYRDDYYDRDDAWYRYDDGYIYEVDPYSRRIVGMVPVSYGDYSVGYPVPAYASYGGFGGYAGYPSHQVPYAYDDLYFDEPGYDYHFAGGGIYQVDPATQLVSALVGLVTGNNFSVGQPLPRGYDSYNVPTQYRANYYDRPDALYRYDDGQIYQVDPRTRIIQAAIPLSYDGFLIGQPIPAGYPAYPVPDYYDGLYYASPDYDYRYFDGGIYQVDRDSQIVSALAALVTGNDLSVGGVLPAGYDAYNLPYAYRDRYQDDGASLYRYSDGRIYQVDPQTRLIRSIIDAVA